MILQANSIYLSDTFAIFVTLRSVFEVQKTVTSISSAVWEKIFHVIDKRFAELISMANGIVILAYVLDPRFAGCNIKVKEFLPKMKTACAYVCQRIGVPLKVARDVVDLVHKFIADCFNSRMVGEDLSKRDPLKYWTEMERIAQFSMDTSVAQLAMFQMARTVFSIVPHSAALERALSFAALLKPKLRNRLSPALHGRETITASFLKSKQKQKDWKSQKTGSFVSKTSGKTVATDSSDFATSFLDEGIEVALNSLEHPDEHWLLEEANDLWDFDSTMEVDDTHLDTDDTDLFVNAFISTSDPLFCENAPVFDEFLSFGLLPKLSLAPRTPQQSEADPSHPIKPIEPLVPFLPAE